MRNRLIPFVLAICVMHVSSLAQSGFSKTGMTAATFLAIEIGPRAAAMGGAYVAIADDPTAMFWNPAGLDKIKNNSIFFSHTNWLAGTSMDYLGAAIPLGQYGTFGVSVTSLGVPEMKVRTVTQPEGTGENTHIVIIEFSSRAGIEALDAEEGRVAEEIFGQPYDEWVSVFPPLRERLWSEVYVSP